MRRGFLTAGLLLCLSVMAASQSAPVAKGAPKQSHPDANAVKITQGPRVEHVTSTQAVIAWSTNVSASTVVNYGTDAKSLTERAQTPWGSLTHRVTLKNLQPGKTYYFFVDSGQAQGSGTSVRSGLQQFQTRPAGPILDKQGHSAQR